MRKEQLQIEVSQEFLDIVRRQYGQLAPNDEVVLVVPYQDGVLLHTKAFYPPGTYRLPTGRMKADESPDDAFRRESREELGREVEIDRKLGTIVCKLTSGADAVELVSHVYLTAPLDHLPTPQDEDEQITDFKAVPVEALPDVAERLRNMGEGWNDWGRFRAVVHEFVAEAFGNKKRQNV